MKYTAFSDNSITLKGHVARLNAYGNGKAMNITIGIDGANGDSDNFVTVKNFTPTVFENLTVGMSVIVHGHVGNASYTDKDGNIKYKDNNDLIADCIEYNETIKQTQTREVINARKAKNN
jgi:hypothetical protein